MVLDLPSRGVQEVHRRDCRPTRARREHVGKNESQLWHAVSELVEGSVTQASRPGRQPQVKTVCYDGQKDAWQPYGGLVHGRGHQLPQ